MQLTQLDFACFQAGTQYMFCPAYAGLCNMHCRYIYINFQLGYQLKKAQSTELHCL